MQDSGDIMYDFAIIGAGYGGLSAAALLAQKGKKILVVEKTKNPGGRSFYFEENGFIRQYGQHSHRLEQQGIAAEVFKRLEDPLKFINVGKGKSSLFYKGKLFKRPEGLGGFLTTKALSFKARVTFIRFYLKLLKQAPENWYDKTFQEFYRTFFHNQEVEDFLSFLAFTVMLPDISAVSAGEVIDFIRRAKQAKVKQGEPVSGAKQVIGKLVTAIKKYHGEIRYSEKVTNIIMKDKTAAGLTTDKGTYKAKNIVYAAPVKHILSIIDPCLFNETFVRYCENLENSSGVVIDFVSKEPLAYFKGGIIGADMPLWVKFQTLIDPSVAPPGYHVCTWGLLTERGKAGDPQAIAETEIRLRQAASACMPGFETKVIQEIKTVIPVINANILTPSQSKPYRPPIKSQDINNLFFVGDTTQGDGCSGDIAFSSALKLADMAD